MLAVTFVSVLHSFSNDNNNFSFDYRGVAVYYPKSI